MRMSLSRRRFFGLLAVTPLAAQDQPADLRPAPRVSFPEWDLFGDRDEVAR
jgi:hypothetical protein